MDGHPGACEMDDGSCGFAWFVLGSGRAPRMLLPGEPGRGYSLATTCSRGRRG